MMFDRHVAAAIFTYSPVVLQELEASEGVKLLPMGFILNSQLRLQCSNSFKYCNVHLGTSGCFAISCCERNTG